VATIRRGHSGSTSAIATMTSASTGMRTKAPRLNSQERSGRHEVEPQQPEREHKDGDPHRPAGALAGAGAVQPDHVAGRTTRPAAAARRRPAIIPARRLGTPEAATVSTMPWTAARPCARTGGGNGAASHGISQPASSSA